MATNLYEVLGIDKTATAEEVRKAYRKRALQTHPDRLPQNVSLPEKKAAEEQFRLVNNAYEVLNDDKNRKLYDQHGVWPPPTATEQPDYARSSSRHPFGSFMGDPFANDPFFSSPFGRSAHRGPAFAFTDPFELFNQIFGDLHSAFDNDPFFSNQPFSRSPFDDPFFRTSFGGSPFGRDPFGGSMFGRSPFGGLLGGSMFPAIESMPSGSRMYSSTTQAVGQNGQWVSRSQMTRTVNGRTEVITKRIDAEGNEHVTYSSPEGERYTINGIEQPVQGSIEGPRRSNSGKSRSSRQPPAPIADRPANSFSVPISGSSHHRHSQAQPVVQEAIVPPPPQPQSDRRSSRHSHRERERERTSHDDPRRGYTTPIPTPAAYVNAGADGHSTHARRSMSSAGHGAPEPSPTMPGGYEHDPHARTHSHSAHSHSHPDHTHSRRDSQYKLHKEHRSSDSQHAHERGHRDSANLADSKSAHSNHEDRGWRGW